MRRASLPVRLWEKVEKTDTCWLWRGAMTTTGYGSIYVSNKRTTVAHRVAYEMMVGPIPEGMHLDHLCRVTSCVNPDHLEVVTPAENVRRGISWDRLYNDDTCRSGAHPWPAAARVFSDGYKRCGECATERYRRTNARRSQVAAEATYAENLAVTA